MHIVLIITELQALCAGDWAMNPMPTIYRI